MAINIRPYRGIRPTLGARVYVDPAATVIVVSEDGPVTVLRNGHLLGASTPVVEPGADQPPDLATQPGQRSSGTRRLLVTDRAVRGHDR